MQLQSDQFPFAARRVLNTINKIFAIYFFKNYLQDKFPKNPELENALIALDNACVDSSLFALRAFDDFSRSQRSKNDDLIASDFPELSLAYVGIEPAERIKINKRLAHLTRQDMDQDVQSYSYHQSLTSVLPLALEFCEYLRHSHLSDDSIRSFASQTKSVCEMVRDFYVNRPDPNQNSLPGDDGLI